ncbi:uncharacterized protein RHOBADRAFT_54494 [Rhodotorula graminis WP1]|uniref:ubiquitinyl hydrolase 1 n=1 Tax=Rhodotorula graminis (strain WP1) TaxID=578459 RepID=A0A0P9GKL9_RHOGW|nr:uncharacterized protein RHOBADRAFT_54494 [Rhodotorula graminis WP1]KPV73906.1 hypothetical protein RHOBADRAFT_54494 [Rhodotorula graminis WP1]
MRRRSSVALPSFGSRRGSNASNSSSLKDDICKDIFHVGLINLGNSCFYNTIVQSLSATQPLNDIIKAAPESSPALRTLSPSSSDYNPDLDALPSPLPMTAALLVLLDKLDPTDDGDGTRGKKAFNPKGLLRQLSLKHDEYAEATQQDSHELLRHLIDGVMMEEQDLIKKIVELVPETASPHRPGMPDRNATEMPMPNGAAHLAADDSSHESDASSSSSGSSSSSSSSDDESDSDERALSPRERKKRQLRPFVGSIFEGKLASFIICDECKNVSLTKEDFMDISLPLKDDTGNKMRKRDRIRRTLQAGFFSRKSGKASGSDADSSSSAAALKTSSLNGVPKNGRSYSENEGAAAAGGGGSASASEADETDEDHIRPPGHAHGNGLGPVNAAQQSGALPRSRHASLDPSQFTRDTARSSLRPDSAVSSAATSRDPSPLGRALSVLSNGSSQGGSGSHGHGHHHHHHFSRRAKIPKPTPEQVRYIKEVLHDIPAAEAMLGGSSTPAGSLPPGLRVARPPGSSGAVPSSAPTSDASSVDSARSSLAKLRIANGAADWQHTDLFECFRQFTGVEVLEGENSFACRNCWKWLNPDLEAKRREERAQKKSARERVREVRRAEREGRGPRAVNDNGNGVAHGGEHDGDDDDDEMDPADRTARNTPAHSPKVVAAFSGLSEVPSIAPLSSPGPAKVAPPPDAAATPSQAPMRSFSMSSAATSNVTAGTSAASTSYDAGLSSDAFETTTDEEDNASQSLDDGASLSGSLSAAPAAAPASAPPTSAAAQDEPAVAPLGAEQLPLTTANVEKVAADPSLLVVPPSRAPAAAGSATSGGGITRAPPSPGATSGKSLASTKAPPPAVNAKPPPKKQRHILRRAHKRYLISSDDLPPVLVIHLKRFMQTSKSSLFGAAFVNLKKRDDPVSFPKEMDLTPFLAPPGRPPRVNPNAFGSSASAPGPGAEITKRSSWRSGLRHAHHPEAPTPSSSSSLSSRVDLEAEAPIELEKTAHNARYRLYAAVVHHGSLDTGHYASYVLSKRYGRGDEAGKGERRWVFCSDEDVTAVSEAEVLRSKAYMLFYERVPPAAATADAPPPAPSAPSGTNAEGESTPAVPLPSLGEGDEPVQQASAKM